MKAKPFLDFNMRAIHLFSICLIKSTVLYDNHQFDMWKNFAKTNSVQYWSTIQASRSKPWGSNLLSPILPLHIKVHLSPIQTVCMKRSTQLRKMICGFAFLSYTPLFLLDISFNLTQIATFCFNQNIVFIFST